MQEVQTLIEQEKLTKAIKRYRKLTGSSLSEAKETVQAMQKSMVSGTPYLSRSSMGRIYDMAVVQDRKIEAIKLYRDLTGSSLLVAKNAVEEMYDLPRSPAYSPQTQEHTGPEIADKEGGLLRLLLILLLLGGVVVAVMHVLGLFMYVF